MKRVDSNTRLQAAKGAGKSALITSFKRVRDSKLF